MRQAGMEATPIPALPDHSHSLLNETKNGSHFSVLEWFDFLNTMRNAMPRNAKKAKNKQRKLGTAVEAGVGVSRLITQPC